MTIENLPKLILDPANEGDLTLMAYERIRTASGGTITDFRAGSAAAAFVEGQTFALAELLYYLNLMPEAIAIEVFRLYGVERSLGTRATGQVTVVLTDFAIDPFVLPAGFSFPYLDVSITFVTSLTVPPGAQEATVSVIVSDIGTQYNANAFDILATQTGIARIQSIFNRLPFTGGSNLEPLQSLIARCQAATVSRSAIITQLDYEVAAQNVLGVGSRAVAVPNLASDGTTYKQASVAVFLLDASGKPASLATCQQVVSDLKTHILIGTAVACFPAVLTKFVVEININVSSLSDTISQDVVESVQSYLRPNTYNGGAVVLHNEVAYRARLVPGVRSVDSVLINGDSVDFLLAQPWYYPVPDYVVVNQIEPSGATLVAQVGFEDLDFVGGET